MPGRPAASRSRSMVASASSVTTPRSRVRTDGRSLKESALTEEKLAQIRALNEIAAARGQTLAEMALAWILKDGQVTSVLIGASRPEQILDNIKALDNTTFTAEELEAIDRASGYGKE